VEYPYFNERLNQIEGTAKKIFTKYLLEHENRHPSILELRNELNNEFFGNSVGRGLDLFSFIEKFITEAKTRTNELTGKNISVSTRQRMWRRSISIKTN
jgi:hypothetical protein